MKVGILKQLIRGFDDDVDINFVFKPTDLISYDLDAKKTIDFETDCEHKNISSITINLEQIN